jgi:ankyrin repeat protein
MQAASTGNVVFVQIIIRSGVSVSVQADDGCTALHCAAKADQIDMISLLIELGGQLEILNKQGRTPLQEAVSAGSTSAFDILVEKGAHITENVLREIIKTSRNELFLKVWARCSKNTIGTISPELFDIAANSGQVSTMATLLSLPEITKQWISEIGRATIYRVICKSQLAMLKCLLASKKLNPNMFVYRYQTGSLIHLAAARGCSDIVGLLLKSEDIDPNHSPYNKISPLCVAALNGHYEVVEQLLKYPGITIQNRNSRGDLLATPLHCACRKGHVDIVRLMLKTFDERELDVDISGGFRKNTPLQNAVLNGNTEVVKLLLLRQDVGVKRHFQFSKSLCQVAVQHGHAGILSLLLGDGRIDRHDASNSRQSLLYEAAAGGHWSMVEILLEYEKIPLATICYNLNVPEERSRRHINTLEKFLVDETVLQFRTASLWHQAAHRGDLSLAMLLLEHDQTYDRSTHPAVDVNSRDGFGRTPLHVAVNSGKIGVIELLLHHKHIDINLTTNSRNYEPGQSAMEIVSKRWHRYWYYHEEESSYVADLLLAHRARSVCREKGGYTENLVLLPLLEHGNDRDHHSAERTKDLRQSVHSSWASVVGIQGIGGGFGEVNSEDQNTVGDIIPMNLDDSAEEDPDAISEELMRFNDEEMSDYNSLDMLE